MPGGPVTRPLGWRPWGLKARPGPVEWALRAAPGARAAPHVSRLSPGRCARPSGAAPSAARLLHQGPPHRAAPWAALTPCPQSRSGHCDGNGRGHDVRLFVKVRVLLYLKEGALTPVPKETVPTFYFNVSVFKKTFILFIYFLFLQCCVGFCPTRTRTSHSHIHTPSCPSPSPPPPSPPPSPSPFPLPSPAPPPSPPSRHHRAPDWLPWATRQRLTSYTW